MRLFDSVCCASGVNASDDFTTDEQIYRNTDTKWVLIILTQNFPEDKIGLIHKLMYKKRVVLSAVESFALCLALIVPR